MAVYRNIQTTFWSDTKIMDNFTPEDKYFYLYLFTNPHTNLCGCYEISKKQVSLETGYSVDTIERLIDRFEGVHKVIAYNGSTKEVMLINWHKYNWTSSEKFRKPLLKEIESVKCEGFKKYLLNIFDNKNTVSIPYQYPIDTNCIDTTVTVTDTVTDTVNNKTRPKKFTPPTVDEVKAYCAERNNNVDAETFVNFYESKNWMVGKNKMTDWKASVRTWESNSKKTSPKPSNDNLLDDIEQIYLKGVIP